MAQPDFRVAQMPAGGCPRIVHYITLLNETFKAGQILKIDDVTGHVEECATDSVNVLGIALADAVSNVAIPVQEITPGMVLSGRNTGAAFVLATHGNMYANLEVTGSPTVHGVEVGQTNAPCMKILGKDDTEDSVTVGTERVLVSFLELALEGAGGGVEPI